MRTILQEFFVNHTYETLATSLQTIVDTALQSDNHKFYTHLQFQHAMDSLTDMGSYKMPGIKTLMDARVAYLQSTSEFTATTPIISSINTSVPAPVINSTFFVLASVTNANSNAVTLGYRFDKTQKRHLPTGLLGRIYPAKCKAEPTASH